MLFVHGNENFIVKLNELIILKQRVSCSSEITIRLRPSFSRKLADKSIVLFRG